MCNAPRTMLKAAVAAGSAVLIFNSFGGTSFAAGPPRIAEQPVCTAVGGALASAGEICASVIDASLPPDSPAAAPATGSALPVLPDLGSPAAAGAEPGLGGLLPTGGGQSGLGGLVPVAPTPPATGGAAASAAPVTQPAPGHDAVPASVATVVGIVDPIIGTLHDSLPGDAAPLDAPSVATVTSAAIPVLTPVLGAANSVGGFAGNALPVVKPIIGPVLATVTALPGQVTGLLNTLVTGTRTAPVSATAPAAPSSLAPSAPVAAFAPTVVAASAVAPRIETVPGVVDRPVAEVGPKSAVEPARAATPRAVASPSSGGESLPITGIGATGIGLAAAAALGWGAFARSLAARRSSAPEI